MPYPVIVPCWVFHTETQHGSGSVVTHGAAIPRSGIPGLWPCSNRWHLSFYQELNLLGLNLHPEPWWISLGFFDKRQKCRGSISFYFKVKLKHIHWLLTGENTNTNPEQCHLEWCFCFLMVLTVVNRTESVSFFSGCWSLAYFGNSWKLLLSHDSFIPYGRGFSCICSFFPSHA